MFSNDESQMSFEEIISKSICLNPSKIHLTNMFYDENYISSSRILSRAHNQSALFKDAMYFCDICFFQDGIECPFDD